MFPHYLSIFNMLPVLPVRVLRAYKYGISPFCLTGLGAKICLAFRMLQCLERLVNFFITCKTIYHLAIFPSLMLARCRAINPITPFYPKRFSIKSGIANSTLNNWHVYIITAKEK